MSNRKSGKDLRKEYKNLLDKTSALCKRIIKRAEELIKKYPDVVYHIPYNLPIKFTVSKYQKLYGLDIQAAIEIIEKIEQHIVDQHPHKQLTIMIDNTDSIIEKKL